MRFSLTIFVITLTISTLSVAQESGKVLINLNNTNAISGSLKPTPSLKDFKNAGTESLIDSTKINGPRKASSSLRQGGATSGGGDDTGLEVQQVLGAISQMLETDTEVFPKHVRAALLEKALSTKLLVTDNELPAQSGEEIQYGAAYSSFDGQVSMIQVQRQRWQEIDDPAIKDSLMFHELAVLAGLERTGEYAYTKNFTKARAKFWDRLLSQNFVCTFSLYKKSESDPQMISKLLGSAGVVVDHVSTSSNFVVLHDFSTQVDGKNNRAVILSYVISNYGYLRAQLAEADVARYKNNPWKIFSNTAKVSKERTYFSPYDFIGEGRGAVLESWQDSFLQVACSKL